MIAVDGFRIDRVIHDGVHGTVYAAHDLDLDRPVALRVVASPAAGPARLDEPTFERLYDECRVPVMLRRHPNVVEVYDVVRAVTGEGCVVTELCDSPSLLSVLAARSLSGDEVAAIAVQIADALAVAHSITPPVVHGGLDAGAVFVAGDASGSVAVTGFGLAQFRGQAARLDPADDLRALRRLFPGHELPSARSAAELRDELLLAGAPLPPRLQLAAARRSRLDLDWRSREVVVPAIVLLLGLLLLAAFALLGRGDPEAEVVEEPGTAPDDLVVLEDRRDSIVLAWTDPPGEHELFIVEAPRDGLRRIIGPVRRDADRFEITNVDPANAYCFWVILPVEGEPGSADDLVHKSNPACIRGGSPDYP